MVMTEMEVTSSKIITTVTIKEDIKEKTLKAEEIIGTRPTQTPRDASLCIKIMVCQKLRLRK